MNSDDKIKLALEHSRALFIYHAGQRMTSLNFYFIVMGFFLGGVGYVATSNLVPGYRAFVGAMLGYAGFMLSKYFQDLDQRNKTLVDCDERLLKYAEQTMANMHECEQSEWKITECSDKSEPHHVRFSIIIPKIFLFYKCASVVGGVYLMFPLIQNIAASLSAQHL